MKKLLAIALLISCGACNNKAQEEARLAAARQAVIDSVNEAQAAQARQKFIIDSLEEVHQTELAAQEKELKRSSRSGGSVTKNYYSSSSGSTNYSNATPAEKKRKLTHTTRGALIGAGAGAITGAATGAAVSREKKGQGALIGAAVGIATGAATGAAIGSQKDKKEKSSR